MIGQEAKEQMMAQAGKLPDYVVACVGGGRSVGVVWTRVKGWEKCVHSG